MVVSGPNAMVAILLLLLSEVRRVRGEECKTELKLEVNLYEGELTVDNHVGTGFPVSRPDFNSHTRVRGEECKTELKLEVNLYEGESVES